MSLVVTAARASVIAWSSSAYVRAEERTAKFNEAIGAAIAGVALADVLAGNSTTVQSVQTGVGSDNRPKPLSPLLNPAPCHQ